MLGLLDDLRSTSQSFATDALEIFRRAVEPADAPRLLGFQVELTRIFTSVASTLEVRDRALKAKTRLDLERNVRTVRQQVAAAIDHLDLLVRWDEKRLPLDLVELLRFPGQVGAERTRQNALLFVDHDTFHWPICGAALSLILGALSATFAQTKTHLYLENQSAHPKLTFLTAPPNGVRPADEFLIELPLVRSLVGTEVICEIALRRYGGCLLIPERTIEFRAS